MVDGQSSAGPRPPSRPKGASPDPSWQEQVAELQDMKQLLLRFQACLEGMEGGLSSQSFTMQGARVCGVLLEVVWLFGRVGVATNPKKSEVP